MFSILPNDIHKYFGVPIMFSSPTVRFKIVPNFKNIIDICVFSKYLSAYGVPRCRPGPKN